MTAQQPLHSLTMTGPMKTGYETILDRDAMAFLGALVQEFMPRYNELMELRHQRQRMADEGVLPHFDKETQDIRESYWKVAPIPEDLLDRRVEITGPVERKMVINALNADVNVFMADFEDAQSPTWDGMIEGQINLRDANRGTISYTHPETGKEYRLQDKPAMLITRVRGIHLPEKHMRHKGHAIPGCLMDFALYFHHNLKARQERGTGMYYYLPKLESHLEAAWWSDIFHFTEHYYRVPTGTIRATVLIETLPAAFQMDEILFAMRDHIVGLNCGRWDYIFSYIKTLRRHGDRVLPDRESVTMSQPFLDAYSRLLIRTCHQRGAFAMGGMSAFIPNKDEAVNQQVMEKVRQDKQREARNGHDGTWVAHPGLAGLVREVFDEALGEHHNQLHVKRDKDEPITCRHLLQPSEGERTERGLRSNIRVALRYIASWLNGNGCVPIYGLMEDAATAEICRTSIWQWIQNESQLNDGRTVTVSLFRQCLREESAIVRQEVGEMAWQSQPYDKALTLLDQLTTDDHLVEFLTLPGYVLLD
ncbi:malate synthase A [Pokkaliibacter sp. CJK22405]|uniref:malate synthase A n=1 Tax=Pokkaliibacter sp. CJK22405 TaxID=3384615 RepID=UPI003984904D